MSETALIVIDVQQGMFTHSEQPYDGDGVLHRINGLVERAQASSTPVIFVQHDGGVGHPLEKPSEGWKVHSGTGYQNGDLVVEKRNCDAFQDTNLQEKLSERNVSALVLTGMMTEYCVDTTCRRAFSQGYKVTLVEDAHTTFAKPHITAEQIIHHHNEILGSGFAKRKTAEMIDFKH
ncbi:MAG: cysteine hydrolase family protein [Sphingorhabdus sp.]